LLIGSIALILELVDPSVFSTGDKVGRFNGVLDCFVKTAKEEGIGAFYKGTFLIILH
jgi:hypothetical protein